MLIIGRSKLHYTASGIITPIDVLHCCENLKPRMKTVFWNVTPGMLVFRYQCFIATCGVRFRAKLRTVILTLLAFPLTRTSRETEVTRRRISPAWTPSVSIPVNALPHFPIINQSNVAQKQAMDSELRVFVFSISHFN